MRYLLFVIIAAVGLTACAANTDSTTTSTTPLPEAQCITEAEENYQPDFVGLTEEDAVDLAAERGLDVREGGRDGECFPVTLDLRDDRINFEYAGGIVVGAAIY